MKYHFLSIIIKTYVFHPVNIHSIFILTLAEAKSQQEKEQEEERIVDELTTSSDGKDSLK